MNDLAATLREVEDAIHHYKKSNVGVKDSMRDEITQIQIDFGNMDIRLEPGRQNSYQRNQQHDLRER